MSDYQSTPGGVPYSPPNSNMAIVSLISGILGLTFVPLIGSIVALITGSMAKREIRESHGAMGGEGMATAGIVLGWIGVGLGVIGLCVGVFFIAIPLCLIPLGIMSDQNYLIAPLLSLLF
jgi:hypothetical protein